MKKNSFTPFIIAVVLQMLSVSCSTPSSYYPSLSLEEAYTRLPATKESADKILVELADDLLFEVDTIDSIHETPAEREVFKNEMEKFLDKKSTKNPTAVSGKSWSDMWPPKKYGRPAVKEYEKMQLQKLTIEDRGNLLKHSMSDPDVYVSNRIGPAVFKMVRENRLDVDVFGGDIDGFLKTLPADQIAFRVPSLYESWGIDKVFVTDAKGTAGKLYFVIPPISEYMQQYGYLLKIAGNEDTELVLDLKANQKMMEDLEKNYTDLLKQLGGKKPTHVFMGYAGQFENMLKAKKEMRSIKKLNKVGSLGGVLLETVDESGKSITLLGLTSDKTLWGEASAGLAKAIIKHTPESLYFMGSAGVLSKKVGVYSISVPSTFEIKGVPIPLENELIPIAQHRINSGDTDLVIGAHHGNSMGPAEQSIEFTDKLLRQKIDTIDVEQALVAKVVADYNAKNPNKKISFGAANLITDKPSTTKYPTLETHNLDGINAIKKQQSRLRILEIMYESSLSEKVVLPASSCGDVIKNFFQINP